MKAFINELTSCSYKLGRESILPPLPPSWHGKDILIPDSIIYYMVEGEILIKIGSKRIKLAQGDIMLIPARTKYACCLTEKNYARKYWFHFNLKNGNNDFFDNYVLPDKIHIGNNRQINSLFKELFKTNNLTPPFKQLLSSAVICKIVAYYMEQHSVEMKRHDNDKIDGTISYIKNNYSTPISLSELAREANYTPNCFIKKFKEKTGYTPIKYINVIRIEAAKYYLLHSSDSIGAIMEKIGFLDSAYFSKLFKKNTGYSPKTFREIHLN